MRNTFLFICCAIFCLGADAQKSLEINPVLHDQSYIAAFGILPDANSPEQTRIQTHLSYVEQVLSSADTEELSDEQKANRQTVLGLLHDYWTAGQFPVNLDYPDERRPCFIDAAGTICAVGYLIEQTKGREVAEQINAKHQYDFLLDMNEPVIDAWATEFGFTLEECAMIQPTYGPPPPSEMSYADIKTGYGVSSGIIGGGNLALSIAGISGKGKFNPALSYIGLVTGTGQLIMGLANVRKSSFTVGINGSSSYTSYKAQNNLSYVNIAVGTGTIITSAINLAINKKIRDKRNAFNLYSYPNYSNNLTMGLSFTRKM